MGMGSGPSRNAVPVLERLVSFQRGYHFLVAPLPSSQCHGRDPFGSDERRRVIRKGHPDLAALGSCGDGEPLRQARFGSELELRLGAAADWMTGGKQDDESDRRRHRARTTCGTRRTSSRKGHLITSFHNCGGFNHLAEPTRAPINPPTIAGTPNTTNR